MGGFLRYLRKAAPGGALTDALADLADTTWSANLAGNSYKGNIPVRKTAATATFNAYYGYNGATPSLPSEIPWSFSSGCYLDGRREYIFTGGGHSDWLGSEVQKFDFTTLEWALTDTSCQYSTTEEDPDAPFQSTDNLGWRTWPNDAGRRTPASSHMYGGMAYMPERGAVFVQGSFAYFGGNGTPGGFFQIDAETGHWDETNAHANSTMGAGGNCVSEWLPEVLDTDTSGTVGRILRVSSGADLYLIDPETGLGDMVADDFSVATQSGACGTIIPDPFNVGRKAYVAPRSGSTTALAIAKRVDALPALTSPNNRIVSQSYGNTLPTEISATAANAQTWIYMGDHKTTTKIVVFHPVGGVFTLDTADWTWSAQIVGLPSGWAGINAGEVCFKRFFYLSDYDCFGLFDPHDGQFYALKLPDSVYA